MIMWLIFVGAAFFAFVLWILQEAKRRPKDFPPGPDGIPLFGNCLQLGMESYKVAMENQRKYGDIQGYRMGSLWLVYLQNADDIREAFNKPEFSGKSGYNGLLDTTIDEGNYGIIMSYGEKWHQTRNFTLRNLRDFGFAKVTSENRIMEEWNEIHEALKMKVGQPFETEELFNLAAFNVIWSILAGERFPHNDEKQREMVMLVETFFKSLSKGIAPFFFVFPWLVRVKKALPWLFPDGSHLRESVFKFFQEKIDEHRKTIQFGEPRDFIDVLIEESRRNKQIQEYDFLTILLDFFVAGSESTSTNLRWALLMLAKNLDVQEKLFQEIQSVAGSRQMAIADRAKMPYLDAVTQELFRISALAPIGAPHSVVRDLTFKGYFFPKGTQVIGNVYAAHHSKQIWGDPENFRPERFLGGKLGGKHTGLIPFGVGKRSCLGESLARDEFFLFFTSIVQNFRVSFPSTEPPHTFDGVFLAGVYAPLPYKIVLESRV